MECRFLAAAFAHGLIEVHVLMKPSVCICCGELMGEHGQELSRNPNICASCSSLVDGMDEPSIASLQVDEVSERSEPPALPGEQPQSLAYPRT